MVTCMPKAQRDAVEKNFRRRVVLVVGSKWMTGPLHIQQVLKKMVGPFAEHLREIQGKPGKTVMYLEDSATVHTSDKCKKSNVKKGLQAQRRNFFQENNVVRHLYSKNGTPEQCWNDQMHKLLLSWPESPRWCFLWSHVNVVVPVASVPWRIRFQ